MIPTWSYSRLVVFEQCPYRAKLAMIDKIPEPERVPPKGKAEHPLDRGTRVHEAAELYVKDNVELIPELEPFRTEFDKLKELFQAGKVSLEGEWAMNRDWDPVAWRSEDAWLRLKLDAMVMISDASAVVIDYKTGRKFGNEVKHAEQGQLYQLVTLMRYPEVEHIHVEFWYPDEDDITKLSYTRAQGASFFDRFDRRGRTMTEAVEFPPKPNSFNCKWCPYGKKGNGHCTYAV